jgi:hypothetical protein
MTLAAFIRFALAFSVVRTSVRLAQAGGAAGQAVTLGNTERP